MTQSPAIEQLLETIDHSLANYIVTTPLNTVSNGLITSFCFDLLSTIQAYNLNCDAGDFLLDIFLDEVEVKFHSNSLTDLLARAANFVLAHNAKMELLDGEKKV